MCEEEQVWYKGRHASSVWGCVAAAREELRQNPTTRVLYLDLDTVVRAKGWCDLPDYEHAPTVMNSVSRGSPIVTAHYTIHGTMVHANAFLVAASTRGLRALRRWEDSYYAGKLREQVAMHLVANGICGIPIWLASHANPQQDDCHCKSLTFSKTRSHT